MSRAIRLAVWLAVSAVGGAFSVSAQTPGGVVIRERVEVTRAAAAPAVAARSLADPCAGPAVAYAVFTGAGYNPSGTGQSTPRTFGAPLSGTLAVSGPCDSASGALTDGFALAFDDPSNGIFYYTPVGEIVRLPLSPTAPLPGFSVTIAGETHTQAEPLHFGCWQAYGATCDRRPPALVTAEIGIASGVDGWATGHAHVWPDTVACGTTTPLPVTLTKPDGTEGYVGPGASQSFQLPGWRPETLGSLVYDGARGGAFSVPYGETRAGGIAYEAPACAAMTAPTGATVWVTGMPGGTLLSDFITVLPAPPAALRVTVTPDTLAVYTSAYVSVSAVTASGAPASLPSNAPVTLSASGPGEFSYQRYASSYRLYGPTITVPYAGATGEAGMLLFTATGATPERDTPVTITAAGGGLSGDTTLVVLGRLRLDLTAEPDSVATGGQSALTSVLRGEGADAFDPAATLTFALDSPSMGTLRRMLTDSTGTTLTGIPRAEAAAGGVTFVAVARQPPPVLARGDSTAALPFHAGAVIRAFVESRPALADTAVVTVGGRSGLRLSLDCDASGRCTVTLAAPDLTPCGGTYPPVVLTVRGTGGRFEFGGQMVTVGPDGGTVTVPYALVASAGVSFVATQTCRLNEATMQAGFAAPVYDCDGEPVLSGDATLPGTTVGAEAPACRLDLVAVPDTVQTGGEVRFTATAPGLSPTAIVTLSVSDLSLGGFVLGVPVARGAAANGAVIQRIRSVTTSLSSIGEVRYLAADDVPTVSIVKVAARADARTGTANVTIIPPTPQLQLLSANDSLYTRGYLMVSRFSASDGGLRATGGFDAPASDKAKRAWYDPFSQPMVVPASFDAVDLYTVRPEVEGIAAGQAVTFRLRVQGSG